MSNVPYLHQKGSSAWLRREVNWGQHVPCPKTIVFEPGTNPRLSPKALSARPSRYGHRVWITRTAFPELSLCIACTAHLAALSQLSTAAHDIEGLPSLMVLFIDLPVGRIVEVQNPTRLSSKTKLKHFQSLVNKIVMENGHFWQLFFATFRKFFSHVKREIHSSQKHTKRN